MARRAEELGGTDEAIETMERLIHTNPHSSHLDEAHFRRGEYFFTRRRFRYAESAYSGIVKLGPDSTFHELALHKIRAKFYMQEFYEEAVTKSTSMPNYNAMYCVSLH